MTDFQLQDFNLQDEWFSVSHAYFHSDKINILWKNEKKTTRQTFFQQTWLL